MQYAQLRPLCISRGMLIVQDVIIKETATMHDQRHPHVLPLYCSFVSGDSLWMVMPFLSGGSVMKLLHQVASEVRSASAVLHARMHPSNPMRSNIHTAPSHPMRPGLQAAQSHGSRQALPAEL